MTNNKDMTTINGFLRTTLLHNLFICLLQMQVADSNNNELAYVQSYLDIIDDRIKY